VGADSHTRTTRRRVRRRSDRACQSGSDDHVWSHPSGYPVCLQSTYMSTVFVSLESQQLSPRRQGNMAGSQSTRSRPSCDSEEAAQSFARIDVSGKLGIVCHILFDGVCSKRKCDSMRSPAQRQRNAGRDRIVYLLPAPVEGPGWTPPVGRPFGDISAARLTYSC